MSETQELAELREQARESLKALKEKAGELPREAARQLDDEAHRNPWPFVALAAFLSLVFGFLLGRQTKR
jgi:ElaB/YqjD/DUF883 family membrane-anchored ribosome-binding protein